MKKITFPLAESSYYQEPHPKDSIFLHHTLGHSHPGWVIDSWGKKRAINSNKIRFGASYVIGGKDVLDGDATFDGIVYEAFAPENWAHHLLIKSKRNTLLNQKSIAIKICNYGDLVMSESGGFYTKSHIPVDPSEVIELESPFRGSVYFHSYTDPQLESLLLLLEEISQRFDIDLKRGIKNEILQSRKSPPDSITTIELKRWLNRNGFTDAQGKRLTENDEEDFRLEQAIRSLRKDPFDISDKALEGYPGLWSHSNVRADLNDVYPHPSLIDLILSL